MCFLYEERFFFDSMYVYLILLIIPFQSFYIFVDKLHQKMDHSFLRACIKFHVFMGPNIDQVVLWSPPIFAIRFYLVILSFYDKDLSEYVCVCLFC